MDECLARKTITLIILLGTNRKLIGKDAEFPQRVELRRGGRRCTKGQPTTDLCFHKIVNYLVITIMYLYTNLTERSICR